jgi:hypothetical protein
MHRRTHCHARLPVPFVNLSTQHAYRRVRVMRTLLQNLTSGQRAT